MIPNSIIQFNAAKFVKLFNTINNKVYDCKIHLNRTDSCYIAPYTMRQKIKYISARLIVNVNCLKALAIYIYI